MKQLFTIFTIAMISLSTFAENTKAIPALTGKVTDSKTGEPIIGAIVLLKGTTNGALTDIDGNYSLMTLTSGEALMVCSYMGYESQQKSITIEKGKGTVLNFSLNESTVALDAVQVTGRRRGSTEGAVVGAIRASNAVVSGISAAQISKTSDRDAGEVIKRIPGISIIDDRFIIVRGLSQRYNNVWINGGAVPSSEADGRAFSFDILPSSQIENMMISKSPAPELPGDFSGGFIKITTKNMPSGNSYQLGFTTGINTITHFNDSKLSNAGNHKLSSGFPNHLGTVSDQTKITELTKNGFNNDWSVREFRPIPDLRFSASMSNRIDTKGGMEIGVVTAAGYSSTYKTLLDIENRRYGIYSSVADAPTIEKDYRDNQYTYDQKVNAMNNWAFKIDNYNRIDFRNLFNLMNQNRLTERSGYSTVSGAYFERQTEMLYTSRLSYTGQLAGNHTFGTDKNNTIDWTLGYSYANKNQPDRRIVSNKEGITQGEVVPDNQETYNDKISRYYQQLDDNIASVAADYKRTMGKMEFKAGIYGEYRSRNYTPREFTYRYDRLSYDDRQEYIYLPFEQMMSDKWLGYDKVYADEVTMKPNAYSANNSLGAAYAAINIPFGKFNVYAGVRYELWNMSLTYDRAMSPTDNLMTTNDYTNNDILPSINATYNIGAKHLLRFAYGRSVNRPEFRELSPSVYYDFDLFAEVQGNPDLKSAYIDNFDLRYEFYPTSGETVSLGLFYKHFKNPIEWNFVDMGGSYRYSYENATAAQNYGVELDVRKSLDFIGAPNLTAIVNATFVVSNVTFDKDRLVEQKDRAMQGQSPYLVNAGFYYNSPKLGLSASVLYNIIGKRIIGIGKANSINGNTDTDLPDSYEMPRNLLDLTIGKKIGKICELKLSVKDILSEKVEFKQFPTTTIDGVQQSRTQTTRSYSPGTTVNLGVIFNF